MESSWRTRLSKQPPDEETRRFNEMLERMLASAEPDPDIAALRGRRAKGVVRLPQAQERIVPGSAGPLKLRIFAAPRVDRIYLHLHDGAWVSGGADMQDWLLKGVSDRCNALAISVEYRLAPEHPHPAALDDAEAAALWLVQHARAEFGTERLMIGGESAGAQLAVSTLLRLRDRHGFAGFSAANLNYGQFDLGLTPSARNSGERSTVMNNARLARRVAALFAGGRDLRDPEVSPLYAELHDLPPALFTVGTLDPFLDDSLFMHARWLAAGNASELAAYPGCVHGFNFYPIAVARRSFEQQVEFLSKAGAEQASSPAGKLSSQLA